MKKFIGVFTVIIMIVTTMASCSGEGKIYPVSREEGSGTRSAFAELTGMTKETGSDMITQRSEITNSTAVMLQTIAANENAIGYVSLGSMSDTVKGVKIDGVSGTAENIQKGSYKIARTFNLVVGEKLSPLTKDFISYITSRQGQNIVQQQGYIKKEGAPIYEKKKSMAGKITIAGSTSVAPVMEVIGARDMDLYPKVKIEIQQSGSSAGILAVSQGICQIGLSSREIQAGEANLGLTTVPIAKDGIVIIVSPENPVSQLSSQQVRDIFSGKREYWQ